MNKIGRFFRIVRAFARIERLLRSVDEVSVTYGTVGPEIVGILSGLGPTFIKFGQMLSLRPDIIPAELADELRKLLDHGIPVDPEVVRALLRSELGADPTVLFEKFEEEPFAVASLAQVHRATYQARPLAIKVQKPDAYKNVRSDLRLIKNVALLASVSGRVRKFKPIIYGAVEEFQRWIERELDYRLEALNIERINRNFEGVKYLRVPIVEPSISSKRILAMDYIEGVALNEIFDNVPDLERQAYIEYKNVKFKKHDFIEHAKAIVFKQVFEDGLFHADPHPGNIILTPDSRIAYVDFGIMGVLQPHMREIILDIFVGMIERDTEKICRALIKLDEVKGHLPIPEIQIKIRRLLDDWQSGSILEMTTAEVFFRLIQIALDSKIDPPYSLIIMGKTLLEYDGDLRRMDPQMDIINSFRALIEKKYGGGMMAGGSENALERASEFVRSLPAAFEVLIKGLLDEGSDLLPEFGPAKKRPAQAHRSKHS